MEIIIVFFSLHSSPIRLCSFLELLLSFCTELVSFGAFIKTDLAWALGSET
jgi:hypothetical protein